MSSFRSDPTAYLSCSPVNPQTWLSHLLNQVWFLKVCCLAVETFMSANSLSCVASPPSPVGGTFRVPLYPTPAQGAFYADYKGEARKISEVGIGLKLGAGRMNLKLALKLGTFPSAQVGNGNKRCLPGREIYFPSRTTGRDFFRALP